MKRRSKVIRVFAVLVFLIITHAAAYVLGVYVFYQTDFCKSEKDMMPMELATNKQFMVACEDFRNSTNGVVQFNAATLFAPQLSEFLHDHPDGMHIAVVKALLGWNDMQYTTECYTIFRSLKAEGCNVYYLEFLSMRPYHVNSVSINIGEM